MKVFVVYSDYGDEATHAVCVKSTESAAKSLCYELNSKIQSSSMFQHYWYVSYEVED